MENKERQFQSQGLWLIFKLRANTNKAFYREFPQQI